MSAKKNILRKLVLLLVFLACFFNGAAQFYSGSNMTFGRKRVQWDKFFWTYYRFERFDVYFNRGGKNLAAYTANYVQNHLSELEYRMGFQTDENFQFIIYNRLTDYKQSNIGYIDEENYNTGGVTKISGSKVFLFFNGDYVDLEKQIKSGVAAVLINQALYGEKVATQVKNNTVISMPEWFLLGLTSYVAEPWSTLLDDQCQTLAERKLFKHFAVLAGEDARIAGHAFWKYLVDNYGERCIPMVLSNLKTTKKVETAIYYAVHTKYDDVVAQWQVSLAQQNAYRGDPLPDKSTQIRRLKQRDRSYTDLRISPDGKHVAYVSNEIGKARIFISEKDGRKKKKVYQMGYSINDKPDYSYPILTWHPSGEILAICGEEKGVTTLTLYDVKTKERTHFLLEDFQKILDFSYDHQGRNLVMSAVKQGQSDIYLYNMTSHIVTQVTNDIYDDANPRFVNRSTQIVFSSNRWDDSLRRQQKFEKAPSLSPKHQLFLYDIQSKQQTLFQLTQDPEVDYRYPNEYYENQLLYLTDENGIFNQGIASFDSVIAAIDTAIHYRKTVDKFTYTNYSKSIQEQDVNLFSGSFSAIFQKKNNYLLSLNSLPEIAELTALQNPLTPYKMAELQKKLAAEKALEDQQLADSLRQQESRGKRKLSQAYLSDMLEEISAEIAGEYIKERKDSLAFLTDTSSLADQMIFADRDSLFLLLKDYAYQRLLTAYGVVPQSSDSLLPKLPPKQLVYNVEFFLNEMTSQVSFSFLNSTYQQFSGGNSPIYLNPGMGGMFKFSMSDLMENYRITAGVGLSLNLTDFEYLLSYENLENRLGRQVVFHRQSLTGEATVGNYSYAYPYKQVTNEGFYILKYPLSEVLLLKATGFLRYDQSILKSMDDLSLVYPNDNQWWTGLKGEVILDHTRPVVKNINLGTRAKLFGEYYQGIVNNERNMFVLGVDVRHYERIYKYIVFASRFAASTSFGKSKLIYYMGGVDDWLFPKFNQDIVVDPTQSYSYQTLATNMRGFTQNIRNGNNFMLLSNEIRIPLFSTFMKKPIKAAWLKNFQVVGFADVGTAWVGLNPWSKDNAIYNKVVENSPITITIERDLDPIVAGIGWGLRTELFGYFIRGDWGYGIQNGAFQKRVFHLSFGLDF